MGIIASSEFAVLRPGRLYQHLLSCCSNLATKSWCVKPRPHQQQCRSNIVERYKLNDFFATMSNVATTLLPFFCNNVAGFGNSVERNFVLSTKSKQIEHVQSVSTLSKGRNVTTESFDTVAVCGNKVECCLDIVAGVDGALNRRNLRMCP